MSANIVLVITDDDSEAGLIEKTLATARDGPFHTERVYRLEEGVRRLQSGPVDIVLAKLRLPDSEGIDTFDSLYKATPFIPIMTMCEEGDEETAIEAVQRGAQGYLSKGHFQSALFPQALRSIIQRRKVEEALFVEQERSRVTLECIGDGVLSTDVFSNVTYLNAEAERLSGWARDDARGRPITEVFYLIDGGTRMPARNPVEMVIQHKKNLALHAKAVLVRRDGYEAPIEDSAAPIFDREGNVTGAVVTFRDVSEAQAMARKMAHLAQHDYLTGLPNRLLFNDRLGQAIAYALRYCTRLAVMFLDLDNFKHINDSLGHSVGDKLLESVAQRLVAQVRHSDTVSRQGGDEFVVLVQEDTLAEHATITAEKILHTLAAPHHIGGHELHITSSIGISLYPDDGAEVEVLMKNADVAMYYAKQKGRNNFQFFNSVMNAHAVERQSTEAELRKAIDGNEFVLHYQPKVDLVSGRVTGAEALIRWHNPQRGMILPDAFIGIAEESGLIVLIGRIVLRQACLQAKAWHDAGIPAITVAINVSALEFRDKQFVTNVQGVLKETGLDARLLQLELTESVLMKNIEKSIPILEELKGMGVQLAVDDFGTGYSSLSYLSQLPIDVLKIDQSFVQKISVDTDNGIIVSTVITMGNSLWQRVIAEGVETPEQLLFLNEHHCNEGQGHLFSAPVPAEDFARVVEKVSNSGVARIS